MARGSNSFTRVALVAAAALLFFEFLSSRLSLEVGTADIAKLGDLGDTRFGESCNVDMNVGFLNTSSK